VDSAKLAHRDPDSMLTSIASIFHSSELFGENFFGETNEAASYVTQGRFSTVTVARDWSAPVKSARGFLRAPWNINPSDKVTRFHSILGADEYDPSYTALVWPTCSAHLGMATSADYDTWFAWSWNAGYTPHGPVHAWVGGVGGGNAAATYAKLHADGHLSAASLTLLKVLAFARLKNLWRAEALETPKSCSADAPVAECKWACVEEPYANQDVLQQMRMAGIEPKDHPQRPQLRNRRESGRLDLLAGRHV
jgi:hypothetical protein